MEIDEKLSYNLFVSFSNPTFYTEIGLTLWRHSLQFDPAPRAGEPLVSRRVPDYFLVSCCLTYTFFDLLIFSYYSDETNFHIQVNKRTYFLKLYNDYFDEPSRHIPFPHPQSIDRTLHRYLLSPP